MKLLNKYVFPWPCCVWYACIVVVWSVMPVSTCHAFVTPEKAGTRTHRVLAMMPFDDPPLLSLTWNSLVVATEKAVEESAESWRQYVPLAASAFVIADVALGSPFAKNVMAVVRSMEQPTTEQEPQQPGTTASTGDNTASTSSSPTRTLSDFLNAQNALTPIKSDAKSSGSERVDTRAVAQQALDKAAASLELRKFLDDSKSDADKLREAQSKLDAQLRAYDEKQSQADSDNDNNNPPTAAFLIVPQQYSFWSRPTVQDTRHPSSSRPTTVLAAAAAQKGGDPLRAATGIRPSLHPLTINALSSILQSRSTEGPTSALRVSEKDKNNLQVALAASQVAAQVIQSRQEQSAADEMTLTAEECQTVAGRIVGVVVRLPALETLLQQKCQAASWIAKYQEWDTFGVLPSSEEEDNSNKKDDTQLLDERLAGDPLFALQRAECLLALFLHTVEKPELATKQVTVPDDSRIDFLDSDRREVLLGE